MTELTVTVDAEIQVVQMVCTACGSRLAMMLRPRDPIRALRFCPVCGRGATFFNAEDRPR